MEYYILVNGEKQGPFSLEQLKEKMITRETMVWHTGLAEWTQASKVSALAALLNELPPESPKEQPGTMPKTWLVESILATIFCCLPFGIVGIVYAARVESRFLAGQYEMAQTYSRKAKTWTLWGFGLGLAGILIYIACVLILGVGTFLNAFQAAGA